MSTRTARPIAHLAEKTRFAVAATAASYAALILLFAIWNFVRASGPSWVIFGAQVLPLLALLPGLWQRYYRSYSWLCFVILFYFIKGVEGVFMSNAIWIDSVFLALTVTTFIAAMLASRWLQRSARQPSKV